MMNNILEPRSQPAVPSLGVSAYGPEMGNGDCKMFCVVVTMNKERSWKREEDEHDHTQGIDRRIAQRIC